MSRPSAPSWACVSLTLAIVATPVAAAASEPPPPPADTPVDVVIHDARPPTRMVSVEWNPLSLIIGKLSANVLVNLDVLRAIAGLPPSKAIDHSVIVVAPFYISTTTWPIYTFDDQGASTQLPQQSFSGFGGELGYRYYTGIGGPRGFFAGPSLILGAMNAKAQNGSSTDYLDIGGALDIGYELLVMDSVALTLGVGAQYTAPDKSIPNQQFPADFYANAKVAPRALASIGWAF
jgi:hypothetical protein